MADPRRFFRQKTPCKNCPFRTDIEGYLNPARAEEIADAVLTHDQSFICHKSIDYNDREIAAEFEHDGEEDENDPPRQFPIDYQDNMMCAGAEIFYQHHEARGEAGNQVLQLAERFGIRDPKRLNMEAPVFTSKKAFMDAQRG